MNLFGTHAIQTSKAKGLLSEDYFWKIGILVHLYEVTSNLAAQQGVWKNKKVDVMKEDFKVPVSLTDIRFWE